MMENIDEKTLRKILAKAKKEAVAGNNVTRVKTPDKRKSDLVVFNSVKEVFKEFKHEKPKVVSGKMANAFVNFVQRRRR